VLRIRDVSTRDMHTVLPAVVHGPAGVHLRRQARAASDQLRDLQRVEQIPQVRETLLEGGALVREDEHLWRPQRGHTQTDNVRLAPSVP
jgi:hypothetical protein